jgi:hypothetical protein
MRLTFLLALITYGLSAQEQVSNIDNFGVKSPTYLEGILEFAKIGDEHYIIQEHDNITIHRIENGVFVKYKVIENIYPELARIKMLTPDKSPTPKIVITDNKYIRITSKTLEIIDIVTGQRIHNVDYRPFMFSFNGFYTVSDNKVFLNVTRFNDEKLVYFDLDILKFRYLPDYFKTVSYFISDDRIIYRNHLHNTIGSWDINDRTVNRLYVSNELIKEIQYSPADKSLLVINESDQLIRIDQDDNVEVIDCNLIDLSGALMSHYIKDRLTVISDSEFNVSQFNIEVLNLNTCEIEVSFHTDDPFGTLVPTIGINRNNDESFTIIGDVPSYYASSPKYILNHEDHSVSTFRLADQVVDYSPVKHDGFIYFAIYNTLDLTYTFTSLLAHNLLTKETKEIEVDNMRFRPLSALIGHVYNEDLLVVTNSIYEEIRARSLDKYDSSQELGQFDFNERLGFFRIYNVNVNDDALYVHSARNIHKVDSETKFLSKSREWFSRLPVAKINDFSKYESKVAYAVLDPSDSLLIYTYDNDTQVLDSIKPPAEFGNSINRILNVGPLILSRSSYFDLETNSFGDLEFDSGNFGRYAIDEKNVYFTSSQNSSITILNLENLTVDTFSQSFTSPSVLVGFDNTIYVIDEVSIDNIRLYKLIDNSTFGLLYENDKAKLIGERNFFGNDIIPNVLPSKRRLTNIEIENLEDGKVIIVSEDTENTYVNEFERKTNTTFSIIGEWDTGYIVNNSKGLYSFDITYGLDTIYLMNPNESLQETIITGNTLVSFTLKDESVDMLELRSYDIMSKEVQVFNDINIDLNCNRVNPFEVLSDKHVLCNCYNDAFDAKPAILNLSDGSLNLLENLNPNLNGLFYGSHYNTTNYVYLPGYTTDNTVQWFRVDKNEYNFTPVPEEDDLKSIITMPTVSNDIIHLEESFEKITILNKNGHVMESLSNYEIGQQINITNFPNGMYYVISYDNSLGRMRQGSFIKM